MAPSSPFAIILAGGQGSRFTPLVTPKPLFPFFSAPLLEQTLLDLKTIGIRRSLIVVSPALKAQVASIHHPGVTISVVVQPKPLGMADALLHTQSLIPTGPLLVRNATDAFEPRNLPVLARAVKANQPFIAARQLDQPFPGGYIKWHKGQVSQIVEKPPPGQEPSDWIKLGFDYFPDSKAIFGPLSQIRSRRDDHYEQALNRFLERHPLQVVQIKGEWRSLKYPHHVLGMAQLFLHHRLPKFTRTASIHPQAMLEGPVAIHPSATVYEGAIIKGPSYIGPGTIVGSHALVRQSLLEANCRVGFGTEVARSYLGAGCQLHQAYVGDSVLESQVFMGAGSRTANRRFDALPITYPAGDRLVKTKLYKLGSLLASEVKVGVNACLMPGTAVGTQTVLGPATIVSGFVPAQHRVFSSADMTMVPAH